MNNSISLPLVGYIELTKGQKAIVDWRDVEWLKKLKWYFNESPNGTGYAARIKLQGGERLLISMHRAVFLRYNPRLADAFDDIDHINGNKLDNRLSNLRSATRHQNSGNRGANKNNKSGYKGVNFYSKNNSWKAQIMDNGKKRHIGYYATPEEAALAYNIESARIFGEFGYQNPIPLEVTEAKKLNNRAAKKLNSPRAYKPFKEVSFHKRFNKWSAYVKVNGTRKHLGYFTTEAEALDAVAQAKFKLQKSRFYALTDRAAEWQHSDEKDVNSGEVLS